jgi:hypothetical protein
MKRAGYFGCCFLGCVLSWSSSALMGSFLVLVAYAYDRLMYRYVKRWVIFWSISAAFLLAFFVASNNPMGWIIAHLTLEPGSGYFRLMIWDAVFAKLSESWYFGFGFNPLGHWILDTTVDSIWLVFALRFGVPTVMLLFLSNIACFLPPSLSGSNRNAQTFDLNAYMASAATAFTTVLCIYMFIGLTVHYWNYLWIFWGVCMGVRASIREWFFAQRAFERKIKAATARARYRSDTAGRHHAVMSVA